VAEVAAAQAELAAEASEIASEAAASAMVAVIVETDAEAVVVPVQTVLSVEAAAAYRAEWHEVQALFISDPEVALTQAKDLVFRAVQGLSAALLSEVDLESREAGATTGTEELRIAMRGYGDFLDRVLGL